MATQAAEPPSGEECALYDPFDAPLPPTFKIVTCGDLWSGWFHTYIRLYTLHICQYLYV